jgi:hypothetical protein
LYRVGLCPPIFESNVHFEKHKEQRISTPRGISIDRSEHDENADDSIRCNPEFDSNQIDENDSHDAKQKGEHDGPGILGPTVLYHSFPSVALTFPIPLLPLLSDI